MAKWTFVGETDSATVMVDYSRRMTKIIGKTYIYIHKGIYPYHDPEYSKRLKKQNGY